VSVVSLAVIVSGCMEQEEQDGLEDPGESEQSLLVTGEVAGWAYWTGIGISTDRSWNSAGGTITATHPSAGNYTVSFSTIGAPGGNVQVMAAGSNNRRCKAVSWANVSGTETVVIKCFAPGAGGTEQDTPFVVSYANFVGGTALSSKGSYALMNQPAGGTLDTTYMWGDSFSVTHESTGVYKLNLAAQNMDAGNVQVTAAWTSDATYCKVDRWLTINTFNYARVRCFDGGGAPADSRFSFRYHKNVNIHDAPLVEGGFVWQDTGYGFNGCSTGCCIPGCRTPPDPRNFVIPGQSCQDVNATVCKALTNCTVGAYTVHYPRLGDSLSPRRGIPAVTAYGANSDYCKITSWTIPSSSSSDVLVGVACYDASGNLTETRFSTFFWSGATTQC
jgi:hypothetical protein